MEAHERQTSTATKSGTLTDPASSPILQRPYPQQNLPTSNTLSPRARITILSTPSRWRRALKHFKTVLCLNHQDPEENKWEQVVLVRIIVEGKEQKHMAVAKFDPHCPVTVVSTHFLETNFKNLTYETWPGTTIGYSVTGQEAYKSIGRVNLDWFGQKSKSRFSSTMEPQFRSRFEKASCEVVESQLFELIIGRPDIERLQLYTHNRGIIATWIGLAPDLSGSNVLKEQEEASSQRDEEKESIKERQKEIKEQKKRDKKK